MSNELMEILQNSASVPDNAEIGVGGVPTDNGPPDIYDRIAGLVKEARELRKAGKYMSAQKKLSEAKHFRALVKKIERQLKPGN